MALIGRKTPQHLLKKWRAVFRQRGEEGLMNDQRGRGFTGRPLERKLTGEEKLLRAEAQVKYLEEEIKMLKKFDVIERSWLKDQRRNTR